MSDLRMPDLNQVLIAGRLTRDPDLKYTGSGRAYCRFGIANSRYYRTKDGGKGEETVFVNCSCWDKQAEFIGERLRKGRPVLVEGRLRSYEMEDRQNGQKRTQMEVGVRRVTPLDWEDGGGSGGGGGYRDDRPQRAPQQDTGSTEQEEPLPEDDIPF